MIGAQTEFAALSEDGRAAYKKALIACSLYAEHSYDPADYKTQCETAYKSFDVEYGDKFIRQLFGLAIITTRMMTMRILHHDETDPYNEIGKTCIAYLDKIYRDATQHAASVATTSAIPAVPNTTGSILIPLQRESGTFVVPVLINKAITLNFVLDSGASDVSIPSDVVLTLFRTGTLQKADFIGTQTYKLADGSTVPSATFRIRSLTVNGVEIGNVKASVAPVAGELLLGQSFLSRFKTWSIDNAKQALVLTQ